MITFHKEIFFLPQENKETGWSQWTPYLLNKLKRVDLLLKLDYAQVLFFSNVHGVNEM